jgi:hypothetical protein
VQGNEKHALLYLNLSKSHGRVDCAGDEEKYITIIDYIIYLLGVLICSSWKGSDIFFDQTIQNLTINAVNIASYHSVPWFDLKQQ